MYCKLSVFEYNVSCDYSHNGVACQLLTLCRADLEFPIDEVWEKANFNELLMTFCIRFKRKEVCCFSLFF